MSVQSEINRISDNIADAYTAAEAKGATMPSAQNSANLAAAVQSISVGSQITVDAALSTTSENPVQNKVITNKLNEKFDKTGGTVSGNISAQYITGTWLQTTAASDLNAKPGKIAVLDGSGWVYYRTPAELLSDLGIQKGTVSVQYSTSGNGASTQVTFPKAYSSKPVVICQQIFDSQNCVIRVDDVSTTGFTIKVPQMGSSGSRTTMWVAIGS